MQGAEMRRAGAVCGVVLLAAAISSCGGSERTTSAGGTIPSGGTTPAGTSSTTRPGAHNGSGSVRGGKAGPPNGDSAVAGKSGTGHSRAGAAVGPSGGGAAAFIVKGGDNSVPEYGSEGSSSEKQEAHDALAAYLTAREEGNWTHACAYLSLQTRERLALLVKATRGKANGCGAVLQMIIRGTPESLSNPLGASLAALRIEGEIAFALFYGPEGHKYAMPMAHQADGWKVTQFAPLPYPPAASG